MNDSPPDTPAEKLDAWRYDGQWHKIPFPYEWNDEEDHEVALRRAGFSSATAWGPALLNQVGIAESDGERWIVSLSVDNNHVHTIEVVGLPNFLDLAPKLANAANASLLADTAARLNGLIQKTADETRRSHR